VTGIVKSGVLTGSELDTYLKTGYDPFFDQLDTLSKSEGSWRGSFTGTGEFGGQFTLGAREDGWQRNLEIPYYDATRIPIVYACGTAYAGTTSACPPQHKRIMEDGKHAIVKTSWQTRLLSKPNSYETTSQFFYNIVAEMKFKGASLAWLVRDNRSVPIAMHRIPHGSWTIHVDPETQEIFYGLTSSHDGLVPNNTPDLLIPARDVIHFRQYCPRHPLLGESPITAAALAAGINVSLSQSQATFFAQMRRPSGVMSTDALLNKDQIKILREAFDEQSKLFAQGGIPILAGGLKFQPLSITSQDAQLIDAQKLTNEDLARVFAVPLPIVGTLDSATLTNSEVLVRFWLSTGLGALLENIEGSLWRAFDMSQDEYIEFDTRALLRVDEKQRVESLCKGIQGGLYTPDEARGEVGLPKTEGGDQTFMQQQMFPINLLGEMAVAAVNNRVDTQQAIDNQQTVDTTEPELDPEDKKKFDFRALRKVYNDVVV
jgi:HK97 family phage portal protein